MIFRIAPTLSYVDHKWTEPRTPRTVPIPGSLPGLRHPVVTKLDCLAHSLSDARAVVEDLSQRTIKLSLAGNVHDPTEPVRRLLFNVVAIVAEFEYDLTCARI